MLGKYLPKATAKVMAAQQQHRRICRSTVSQFLRSRLFLQQQRQEQWLMPSSAVSSLSSSFLNFHSTAFSSSSSSLDEKGGELPYHIVVGLPALSPTMENGSLAEWYVKEGDSFSAGDVIAKIETDKATIDFEAQDDGNVAKLLLEAGGGASNYIPIGTPIMITVEDPEDVAAFQNYVHKEEITTTATTTTPPAAAIATEAKEQSVPPAAPATATATPASTPTPPSSSPPPQQSVAAATPVAEPVPPSSTPVVADASFTVAWGMGAVTKSPMAKTLAKEHLEYIEKYGTTGQRPLL